MMFFSNDEVDEQLREMERMIAKKRFMTVDHNHHHNRCAMCIIVIIIIVVHDALDHGHHHHHHHHHQPPPRADISQLEEKVRVIEMERQQLEYSKRVNAFIAYSFKIVSHSHG